MPLVLPNVPGHKRVIYTIYEYDPLLDSSNMTMDDWIQIAKDIRESYANFDGCDIIYNYNIKSTLSRFVILHGTDTLAYTSSALSFMLENLGKPVRVTMMMMMMMMMIIMMMIIMMMIIMMMIIIIIMI